MVGREDRGGVRGRYGVSNSHAMLFARKENKKGAGGWRQGCVCVTEAAKETEMLARKREQERSPRRTS